MEPLNKTRIKICCIMSPDEALLAIKYGASALGLVSEMPSGPGVIKENLIGEIVKVIPPGVASFLLTSKTNAADIIAQQKKCGTNTLQLCDRVENGTYEKLKKELPGISIVQVIHVTGPESIDEAIAAARHVDAVLLDSGNQNLPVKELGGTGKTHDWSISKIIREKINVPLYLAGGLNPANIEEAINAVRPFGVDICSGVRTKGRLDENKLSAFTEVIHKNFYR